MNKFIKDKYHLNTKGFTLIEMLAAVVLIALLSIILIPNTLETLGKGNDATYNILVEDITTASKLLFDELEYVNSPIYYYDIATGKTDRIIKLETTTSGDYSVTLNIQTLISNGFLTGTNNYNLNNTNINKQIITHPKTKEDIGACQIIITKTVDKNNNYKTKYTIKNNSIDNANCPTDNNYKEVLK